MPSRAFQRAGLVHMSISKRGYAWCGTASIPYGIVLTSTDAALEYAALLAVADDEVTCLECIVEMGLHPDWYDDDLVA